MSGRLVLAGLSKRHPGSAAPALDGVDLDVEAGRCLVLLGESGSGKTTLLRVVAGLERADAGTVMLDDRTLSEPRIVVPPERRGVGMVFQSLELWPHMTAAEHVAFGLPGRPRGRRARKDARVVSLAREVGLDASHLARRPGTLSGGERQRVAIARTLAAEPALVLYDEPLANLDPGRRAGVRTLIRRLSAERGTTTVHVTHDAEEALAMGDEIAVLAHGRLVERGAPDALFMRPRTLVGARALGPVTALPARVADGVAETVLGRAPLGDSAAAAGAAARGPVLALWRPSQMEVVVPGAGTPAEVAACHSTGPRFFVTAYVEGHAVHVETDDRVVAGTTVGLAPAAPAVVVPAAAAHGKEAA